MTITPKELLLTSQKIGEFGIGDCYSTHIVEVWQNLKTDAYYKREIYYAGDDEGYDKVTEILEIEAEELIKDDEFDEWNNITDNLKSFIKANYNACIGYAKDCFAGDILQAAEYLYNQI